MTDKINDSIRTFIVKCQDKIGPMPEKCREVIKHALEKETSTLEKTVIQMSLEICYEECSYNELERYHDIVYVKTKDFTNAINEMRKLFCFQEENKRNKEQEKSKNNRKESDLEQENTILKNKIVALEKENKGLTKVIKDQDAFIYSFEKSILGIRGLINSLQEEFQSLQSSRANLNKN